MKSRRKTNKKRRQSKWLWFTVYPNKQVAASEARGLKPRKEKCFRVDKSHFSHLLFFISRLLLTTNSFHTRTFTTDLKSFTRKWMADMISQSLRLLKNFMINTFRVQRDVLRSQLQQRSTSTSESNFSLALLTWYRVVCCEIAKHKLCCRTWRSIRKLGRRLGRLLSGRKWLTGSRYSRKGVDARAYDLFVSWEAKVVAFFLATDKYFRPWHVKNQW